MLARLNTRVFGLAWRESDRLLDDRTPSWIYGIRGVADVTGRASADARQAAMTEPEGKCDE